MGIGTPTLLVNPNTASGTGISSGAFDTNAADETSTSAPAGALVGVYVSGADISDYATAIVDNQGNTYDVTAIPGSGSIISAAVGSLIAPAGGLSSGTEFKVTNHSGGAWVMLGAFYATGINSATPDKTGYIQGPSASTTFSSAITTGTLSQANELVVGFSAAVSVDFGSSYTPGVSFANFGLTLNGVAMDYQVVDSTGSVSYQPSWQASSTYLGLLLTFEGSSSSDSLANSQKMIFMRDWPAKLFKPVRKLFKPRRPKLIRPEPSFVF